MSGMAMLTIVRSSSVMKKPSDTTTRTAHGFPRSLAIHPTIAHQRRGIKIYLNPNGPGYPPRPAAHRLCGAETAAGMLPAWISTVLRRSFPAARATVVIADLNENRGKQIADEIGGQFARTDVTDEASVQAAVDLAVATGEPLRTGVSCAGIGWASRTVGRDGTPHDLASYQKVIAVNLIGTFNVMRIAAAAIAKTEPADADGQRGVVINTSSVAGIEGQTGQIAYSASKGGIIGMTVPGARDLAAIGVRVNTICPGIIDTPIYGLREGAAEFKARLAAPGVFP